MKRMKHASVWRRLGIAGLVLASALPVSAQWKGVFERNSFPGGQGQGRNEAPGANEVKRMPVGFGSCPQFFPDGRPISYVQGARELCFNEFAVAYNPQTRSPAVVIERLNAQSVRKARLQQRTDQFFEDARVPAKERAYLRDYQGSGYHRGHMAPAGNMSTPEGMAQSFALTNVVPQDPVNNTGIWSDLESSTRKYVLRAKGDVYLFTGPLYGAQGQTIGRGIPVPTSLWKVVYDAADKRAWVFWVRNDSSKQSNVRIDYAEFLRRGGPHVLQSVGF